MKQVHTRLRLESVPKRTSKNCAAGQILAGLRMNETDLKPLVGGPIVARFSDTIPIQLTVGGDRE